MERVISEVWNRLEQHAKETRKEMHNTRVIFAAALYAAAASILTEGTTAGEISAVAFKIDPKGGWK